MGDSPPAAQTRPRRRSLPAQLTVPLRTFLHDELEPEDLLGYAAALDMDVERFARDLSDPRHDERVRSDVAGAEASGARGTPTFFINGMRHVGPYDAETLVAALTETRATTG